MGFNPRLAPYSISYQQDPFLNGAGTDDVDWFRFPFAGELLSAYAAVQTNIATDTTTALTTVAIGKSDAGTGAYAAASSRVVTGAATGSTWDNATQYTLANNGTLANVQFAAGDWAMIRIIQVQGASVTNNTLSVQMDYVIGHEEGTTANAGTGPAS